MPDKSLKKHYFVFNKNDNGGEQLTLTTEYFHNGDKENGIYTNQQLTLHSYCNEATFSLSGASIDSKALRELANQLDEARIEAKELAKST